MNLRGALVYVVYTKVYLDIVQYALHVLWEHRGGFIGGASAADLRSFGFDRIVGLVD